MTPTSGPEPTERSREQRPVSRLRRGATMTEDWQAQWKADLRSLAEEVAQVVWEDPDSPRQWERIEAILDRPFEVSPIVPKALYEQIKAECERLRIERDHMAAMVSREHVDPSLRDRALALAERIRASVGTGSSLAYDAAELVQILRVIVGEA